MPDPFDPTVSIKNERIDRASHEEENWQATLPAETDELVESDRPPRQFLFLRGLFLLALVIFTIRLTQLQITVGAEYRSLSEGNSLRVQRLPADRGIIFDTNGKILARNTKKSAFLIRLEKLPGSLAEREPLYGQIRAITDFPPEKEREIEGLFNKITGDYLVGSDLNQESLLLLEELGHRVPAVLIGEKPIRQYDSSNGLGHILGYVGQVNQTDLSQGYGGLDTIGKVGIEHLYELNLRGAVGLQQVEVNSKGETVRDVASNLNHAPQAGDSLRLAIDADLQGKIAAILQTALDKRNTDMPDTKNLGATAVVLDPRNGLIKALVSLPAYDGNLFASGISKSDLDKLYNDPTKPMLDRAIAGTYPPGSTIKPIIASGALYYKIVSPSYTVDTPTEIKVGDFTFPDWKDHGPTNIRTAIAESNNIFFYMLGGGWEKVSGLGLDRLRTTMHWFGLESKTGIDLDGETSGFILSDEWKRQTKKEPVYLGDVYHLSIGQGDIGITPIQMSTAVAAIANGGTMYEPRLAAALVDGNNKEIKALPPVVKSQVPVDNSTLQIVREGMRQAVTSGSSRPLNTLSVKLAGKTGTAQFGTNNRTHAWFTGFGPYDKPDTVLTVMVEGGGESFDVAIPLAEEIFRVIFNEPAAPNSNTPTNVPAT